MRIASIAFTIKSNEKKKGLKFNSNAIIYPVCQRIKEKTMEIIKIWRYFNNLLVNFALSIIKVDLRKKNYYLFFLKFKL